MTDTQAKEIFRASFVAPAQDRIDVDAAIRQARRRRGRRRAIVLGAAASVLAVASFVTVSLTGWPQGLIQGTTIGQAGVTPADNRLQPSPKDRIFEGLPADVVAEVLDNPAARANIDMPLDPAERNSLWQGMVTNFIMCRQLLGIYQAWEQTGTPPIRQFVMPEPKNPLQPSYRSLQSLYEYYGSHMRAGQIDTLRADLLNESACGNWIPAKPGDVSGPTIADAVRGGI